MLIQIQQGATFLIVIFHQLIAVLHQHDVHQNHTHLSENEVQHDIFSGYVTTNSDTEDKDF